MPVRVLIADSDEYLLDQYRGYLEQHGCHVTVATTGLECVEKLRKMRRGRFGVGTVDSVGLG